MRKLLRLLLARPVLWLVARFSSHPNRERVFHALTRLHREIAQSKGKKGPIIPFDARDHRFIIFSDQHKGAKDGADDFAKAEPNYLSALHYYDLKGFHFINLGDGEELWENSLAQVKKYNQPSFEAEKRFINRGAFTKIFGNHDLFWDNDPLAGFYLKSLYQTEVSVNEGVLLQTVTAGKSFSIFCTHGHQGDAQSDGNWFSKFFVSNIWGPLQSYLSINPNTPSCNDHLKTAHNQMMYEWSSQQNDLLLITGHTHQPVFESLTRLERLYSKLAAARAEHKAELIKALEAEIKLRQYAPDNFQSMVPSYFNSGCCCFNDGDITGIEIADEKIRLIKWEEQKGKSERIVLEEVTLEEVVKQITEEQLNS